MYMQVLCGKCGNGLGHEFLNDGPEEGLSRFWIFSHSLKFVPKGKSPHANFCIILTVSKGFIRIYINK